MTVIFKYLSLLSNIVILKRFCSFRLTKTSLAQTKDKKKAKETKTTTSKTKTSTPKKAQNTPTQKTKEKTQIWTKETPRR